ncbi:hypothetical protein U9M48_032566 [Paspalum notatum var. saurae]|uniref:Uncharacterized protein n=1 Tax=Paspalum notatum var. saurae TaxID=547442 RepID=A0AAQ3X5J8_PASNO
MLAACKACGSNKCRPATEWAGTRRMDGGRDDDPIRQYRAFMHGSPSPSRARRDRTGSVFSERGEAERRAPGTETPACIASRWHVAVSSLSAPRRTPPTSYSTRRPRPSSRAHVMDAHARSPSARCRRLFLRRLWAAAPMPDAVPCGARHAPFGRLERDARGRVNRPVEWSRGWRVDFFSHPINRRDCSEQKERQGRTVSTNREEHKVQTGRTATQKRAKRGGTH